MSSLYWVAVWLHVVAAAVWLGGMVFLAFVLVFAVREPPLATHASLLISRVGVRFRTIAWLLIGVLVTTGLVALAYRGIGVASLIDGTAWTGSFGHALRWKLALVAVLVALSVVHDFFVGPRASRAARTDPNSPRTLQLRKTARVLGRATLVITLVIFAIAIYVARAWQS